MENCSLDWLMSLTMSPAKGINVACKRPPKALQEKSPSQKERKTPFCWHCVNKFDKLGILLPLAKNREGNTVKSALNGKKDSLTWAENLRVHLAGCRSTFHWSWPRPGGSTNPFKNWLLALNFDLLRKTEHLPLTLQVLLLHLIAFPFVPSLSPRLLLPNCSPCSWNSLITL